MRSLILIMVAGVTVSGCVTRGDVRAARYDARVQSAECREARAYGGRRAQRIQCAQAREARAIKREVTNSY